MRTHLRYAATLAILVAGSSGTLAGQAPSVPAAVAESTVTAFVDVNVIPMDTNRVLGHQTVVVRAGRITAMGSTDSVAIPADATRIEGTGKFLIPGLVDMHVHLPDTSVEATTRALQLYIINGVTTLRVMSGRPDHLTLRDRIADGQAEGPSLYVAAATAGGVPGAETDLRRVLTGQEAARLANRAKQAGYDFIQLGSNLMREEFDGLMGAARRLDLRVAGGVPDAVGLQRVLRSHPASIESLDGYISTLEADDSPLRLADPLTRSRQLLDHLDEHKIPRLARDIRDAGVANIPTIVLNQTSLSREPPESQAIHAEMRYVPRQLIATWVEQKWRMVRRGLSVRTVEKVLDIRTKLVKGLFDEGALLLVGSDAPGAFLVPGFATHAELQSFVGAGIPSYNALVAATREGAKFLRGATEFGTVAVGRRADLVLLEGNPLEDITQTTRRLGVMLRGRWMPASELQAMLDAIAEAVAKAPA